VFIERLESFAKVAALAALASYAMGYLIVASNDAAHGFLETSLLKPRAIAAGAIFVLSVSLPISMTQHSFLERGEEVETFAQFATRVLLGLMNYALGCVASAWMLGMILQVPSNNERRPVWQLTAFELLFLIFVIVAVTRTFQAKYYRQKSAIWLGVLPVAMVAVVAGLWVKSTAPEWRCLLWMMGVTVLVNPYIADHRRGLKRNWSFAYLAAVLLGALAIYSHFLYPVMKAKWGGGAPVEATFYLSQAYPLHSGKPMKANVFEVSDSGFYVAFEGDASTAYVPSNSVLAIEYSPEPPLPSFRIN
jgi:hypothetical protein